MTLEGSTEAAEREFATRLEAGPQRLRWDTLPLQPGDPAPDLELDLASGGRAALSSFWAKSPAIIMFWRHFGCGCGTDRAQRLAAERVDYAAVGAGVVIVAQGEPDRAMAYAAKHAIEEPILCDPQFDAYEAYGVLDGGPAQIVFDAPEEYLRRERQPWDSLIAARREAGRPLVDSPWRLPAEFVIGTGGVVRLAFRYQYCEGFPDHRVLLAAVKEAQWAAGGTICP